MASVQSTSDGTQSPLPRVVLAVGAAVLVIALVVGGTRASRLVLGSNDIRPEIFVAVVAPGKVLCQTGQELPAQTGLLRMTIGTYGRPGPELRTEVQDRSGRPLLRAGRLAAGWKQGPILVPLGGSLPRTVDARVCIANRGTRDIAVGGSLRPKRVAARVAGRPADGRVSLFYLSGEHRTPFSLAGAIVDRIGAGQGPWSGVAPWAVLVLVALMGLFAVRAVWSVR